MLRTRMSSLVMFGAMSLACSGLEGSADGSCTASGIYTVCTLDNGYRSCTDHFAQGMGIGPNAATDAVAMCTDHQLKMVIIGNMNGEASVKQSCQLSGCEQ